MQTGPALIAPRTPQLWGPSGKVINMRKDDGRAIKDRLWWAFRTLGMRSTKWGTNVARHHVARPSIQGAWTPRTAALLQDQTFDIQELQLAVQAHA
jgi:hypothetical protein